MTTTEPTTAPPAWLNLDAIHPPEERAKLGAMSLSARAVLDAVADFNRQHIDTMHAYFERNDYATDGLANTIDEITGMQGVVEMLMLAGVLIEATVPGQGNATDAYAKELVQKWSDRSFTDALNGVQALYGLVGDAVGLPVAGRGAEEVEN